MRDYIDAAAYKEMILCAEAPDGSLALMTPEAGRDVPAGSEIG